jgi:predicted permease
MEDLIFSLNAVLPIVLLIAFGYFLKSIKLLNKITMDTLNRLCFKVLLPVLLFINVYDCPSISKINPTLLLFILASSVTVFLLGMIFVIIYAKQKNQRGVLLQGIFRSNYAIIGIVLAESIAGKEGALVASLVTLVTIPLSNTLSTIALVIFVEGETQDNMFFKVLKKVVTNPLIIGVLLGILCLVVRLVFEKAGIGFRLSNNLPFLYQFLKYLSGIASTVALITLGGLFEFGYFSGLKKLVLAGVAGKLVVVPLLALGAGIIFFDFTGAEYATLIAVYATPVAVSSAVMAKEMKNDDTLANQIVVWTTILSGITLFAFVFLFKARNIF